MVGRVPEGEQLSRDSLSRYRISAWKVELDGRGEPRGAAQPYSVAILIALELVLGDTDQSFSRRLMAWTMLIGVWGCMRVDDIQSVAPESVRVSSRGLTMRLSRSKTIGLGKLHGQVHAFVRRDIGVELLQSDSLMFPRDYLIPAPHTSWTACRKKILEPPQLANHFRMVLQSLGTSKLEDGTWRTNVVMELVPGDLCLFWPGHSPRHFLPQAAASIGCSKPDRDFLGRWAIGKMGSNAYLITSRQIVERIQGLVLELMQYEQKQHALDGMEVDDGDPVQVEEAGRVVDNADQIVFEGPLTLEQSVNIDIDGINSHRRRMINEIHERLAEAEAYSNQELIWGLEELDWWTNIG